MGSKNDIGIHVQQRNILTVQRAMYINNRLKILQGHVQGWEINEKYCLLELVAKNCR